METGQSRSESIALPEGLHEAVRFLLVGLANTFVDAAVYFALSSGVFFIVVPRLAAKALSYAAGVGNSFYWNRRWTFRSEEPIARTLPAFTLTNLAGLVLNVVLLHVSLEVLRLQELAAVAAAAAGVVLWNFSINKFLVFRERRR
jgi:putative flippase GtrA